MLLCSSYCNIAKTALGREIFARAITWRIKQFLVQFAIIMGIVCIPANPDNNDPISVCLCVTKTKMKIISTLKKEKKWLLSAAENDMSILEK